jgi:hypothetical protein
LLDSFFQLSEVKGGATVFPRSAISLWPQKGSAAFWWNLDRSGTGDENTRHGACPVLYGDKWGRIDRLSNSPLNLFNKRVMHIFIVIFFYDFSFKQVDSVQ